MNLIEEVKFLARRVAQLEKSIGVETPPPEEGTVTLVVNGANYLTIHKNGDVVVRGKKVGNDGEILTGFRQFLQAVGAKQKQVEMLVNAEPKGNA